MLEIVWFEQPKTIYLNHRAFRDHSREFCCSKMQWLLQRLLTEPFGALFWEHCCVRRQNFQFASGSLKHLLKQVRHPFKLGGEGEEHVWSHGSDSDGIHRILSPFSAAFPSSLSSDLKFCWWKCGKTNCGAGGLQRWRWNSLHFWSYLIHHGCGPLFVWHIGTSRR